MNEVQLDLIKFTDQNFFLIISFKITSICKGSYFEVIKPLNGGDRMK